MGELSNELRRRIGLLAAEKAWLLEDIQELALQMEAQEKRSVAPPLKPSSDQPGKRSSDFGIKGQLKQVTTFLPKKAILSEPRVLALAGVMMVFLLPYLTNQNGITSSNSSDMVSYLTALRDFWASILQRVIAR